MSKESQLEYIKRIKSLITVALFSDNYFLDNLVLKGGNAIDIAYNIGARSSVDLDFSIENDFPENPEDFAIRIEKTLNKIFVQEKLKTFDVKVKEKPENFSEDLKDFWGGYDITFKLIDLAKYEEFSTDLEKLRRNAIQIGKKSNLEIDISRFEYVAKKEASDLNGYTIYVYSVEMLILEKLRAICQQMPEYNAIVHRSGSRSGVSRARDFVDIYTLMIKLDVNLTKIENKEILLEIFKAKRVPIEYLFKIKNYKDLHKQSFPAVIDTVNSGTSLEKFDFYFDYVTELVSELKTKWNI